MPTHPARRLLAVLAAAGAATLGLAAPADAAPASRLDVADALVVSGFRTNVRPKLITTQDVAFGRARLTVELSGDLTGVRLVPAEDGPWTCTSTPATALTCDAREPFTVDPLGWIPTAAVLTAGDTAVLGATGAVKVTLTDPGKQTLTDTGRVRVAEGVDLQAGIPPYPLTGRPGGRVDVPLQVSSPRRTVHGVALVVDKPYAYAAEPFERYENCAYDDGKLVYCVFDDAELQPDVPYRVRLPFRLRGDTYAPNTVIVDFEWQTLTDFQGGAGEDGPNQFPALRSGPTLRLEPAPAERAAASVPQTEVNRDTNLQSVTIDVLGSQGADPAAIGAKVSGAAGKVVHARVGVRNNGPAALNTIPGQPARIAVVTIPEGAQVATVPAGCEPVTGGRLATNPKAVQYACSTGSVLPVGKPVTWNIGLRIRRVVPNATGAVEVVPGLPDDPQTAGNDKSNDKAALILNPAGGTGGSGGSGGGEPGLPITGPAAGSIAGVGVVLVALGVLALVLTRRRRTSLDG
ncbi:hypothetical protein [Actinoplanes siamensis]|uniref:DUF11 domain-containing protein n=1 Tax=Actinoplanes siamensis TaxID=1223317 RepID=A0A919NFT8_9ACTN|nr:hypothetical protein [Actinoplanes siamensis]GIF09735.1 hypothetical protein Asi03nite_72730 [Actinoplanes siamensis]